MKKQIALVLAAVLLLTMFAGCSGKSDTVISATAFGTESVLALPLKAELNQGDFISYGGFQFETSKSLEKMSSLILENNENVVSETCVNAYGECRLFTRQEGGYTDSWCLYALDPANMSDWYIFCGAKREIETKDGTVDLLLPLHLISDHFVRDNMGNRLALDTQYACGLQDAEKSMEELFSSFYQFSGHYSVTQLDDGFSVLPAQGMPIELKFTFSNHDETDWFTITDVTERDPEPTEKVSVRWVPDDPGAEPFSKELIAEDALQLSALLIRQFYDTGAAIVDYPYLIDADGEIYNARVFWENNAWAGAAEHGGNTATFTTEDACEFAALMYINGLHALTEDVAVENLLPMAACMKATTEVNIRFEPSTSGAIMRTSVPDEPFAIVGRTGDWYQILMGNQQLVYMNADYLK